MPLESRGLDHVMMIQRDLGAAADAYERLGFQVTRRMYHPFGTANNLIMFEHDFLELLGVVEPEKIDATSAALEAFLEVREGIGAIACLSTDARADQAEFEAKGIASGAMRPFRRPVKLPGGREIEAVVDTVWAVDRETPLVIPFLSQQHVREAIWVPEWQTHPNGAKALRAVVLVDDSPRGRLASHLTKFFDPGMAHDEPGGVRFETPNGRILILAPAAFAARYAGIEVAAECTLPHGAALEIAVADLSMLRGILEANEVGFAQTGDAILVPTSETFGTVIRFTA